MRVAWVDRGASRISSQTKSINKSNINKCLKSFQILNKDLYLNNFIDYYAINDIIPKEWVSKKILRFNNTEIYIEINIKNIDYFSKFIYDHLDDDHKRKFIKRINKSSNVYFTESIPIDKYDTDSDNDNNYDYDSDYYKKYLKYKIKYISLKNNFN